ncbi:hypothetical protein NMY22_g4851 [Coprinellus aureogranulatus]|nr:hypothetical protein NMY22_g4851 [Coprinellus aureogranulatus]
MQLTYLLSTFTVLAVTGGIVAQEIVTYRGYSNTVSCSGDNFFCPRWRTPRLLACPPHRDSGSPAQFRESPWWKSGTRIHWRRLLRLPLPGLWPRYQVLERWRSSCYSPQLVPQPPEEGGCRCEGGELRATPDGFEYRDAAGVQHTIDIPAGNATAAEEIAKHYTNKDWKALSKLETA